jgi:ABC-2 type transport system permease protein
MQAYLLSFTMKMILGSIAFWVIDIRGVFQVFDMITWIFAGYVVPLNIFPQPLQQIAYALPFSYIIYFPITAFQGKLNSLQLVGIIAMQLIWIALLFGLYQFMWRKGVRKFTGVGQ